MTDLATAPTELQFEVNHYVIVPLKDCVLFWTFLECMEKLEKHDPTLYAFYSKYRVWYTEAFVKQRIYVMLLRKTWSDTNNAQLIERLSRKMMFWNLQMFEYYLPAWMFVDHTDSPVFFWVHPQLNWNHTANLFMTRYTKMLENRNEDLFQSLENAFPLEEELTDWFSLFVKSRRSYWKQICATEVQKALEEHKPYVKFTVEYDNDYEWLQETIEAINEQQPTDSHTILVRDILEQVESTVLIYRFVKRA